MATTVQTAGMSSTGIYFSPLVAHDTYSPSILPTLEAATVLSYPARGMGRMAGDQIRYDFVNKLIGVGTGEGQTQTNNEEAMNTTNQTMVMNVFRHAVRNPNDFTIEQQRTRVDFEKEALPLLAEHLRTRLNASAMNQMAGVTSTDILVEGTTYSGTNRLFVQGLNTPDAPSSGRIIRAAGAATDEALVAADTFTLSIIDQNVARATTSSTSGLSFKSKNGKFIMVLDPISWQNLKQDAGSQIQLVDMALAQTTNGDMKNFLFGANGAENESIQLVAMYQNTAIYVSNFVPFGQNSSTSARIANVRRCLFLGVDALAFASPTGGFNFEKPPLQIKTELQDYDYYKGIGYVILYGMKKKTFTNYAGTAQDVGVIVNSVWAA